MMLRTLRRARGFIGFVFAIATLVMTWRALQVAENAESKAHHHGEQQEEHRIVEIDLEDDYVEQQMHMDRAVAAAPAIPAEPVSYDRTTPPGTGCEEVVGRLQHLVLSDYAQVLKGIRFANMWGYLETDNKGDAAIWTAQQMVMASLGIDTMMACRFQKRCDMEQYRKRLVDKKPHSAIIMAGGGNFNDFYWTDQPERIDLAQAFHDIPMRMFPQSIYMKKPKRIEETHAAFTGHPDLQLGARDQPSFDWLNKTFGPGEKNGEEGTRVKYQLSPDIVFAYGNRPDYRTREEKKYDIFIMARKDAESSTLHESSPQSEEGVLQLGRHKVTYLKKDWNNMPTPHLGQGKSGNSQRAFLRADEGFKILGRSEFVVTDRLHGHIMSTVMGLPHVLMDSKLGKNLALHDTWTADCDCTRIADSWEESMKYAELFFEKAYKEGRWTSSVPEDGE